MILPKFSRNYFYGLEALRVIGYIIMPVDKGYEWNKDPRLYLKIWLKKNWDMLIHHSVRVLLNNKPKWEP